MISTCLLPLFKTWHVAEKGPDRSNAQPEALAPLKKRGFYVIFCIDIT